eukprot:TRINITY_DN667_c0_g1_i1.p1 TRINITY_DN667_c0_g1~~TRINITY_DN667_c0_g1_i1.p1  ORF type:complete len:258 (-),score=56.84 TRINITY_DN667_c0_g1_i1:576-1349(-)
MAAALASSAVVAPGLAAASSSISQKLRSSFSGNAVRFVAVKNCDRLTMESKRGPFDLWIPDAIPPPYLDGSLPADRGFDPLGLAWDAKVLNRYVEGEVINGRWAMLAVAGSLVAELGGQGNFGDSAKLALSPDGAPVVGLLPVAVPYSLIGLAGVAAIGFAEAIRLNAELTKGYDSLDDVYSHLYPGFDPLGFTSKDKPAEVIKEWRTKEIKNGRLAMIAFVGFVYQYIFTGAGPVQNLTDHLASPHVNWLFGATGI